MTKRGCAALLLVVVAAPAAAVDGVLEINQTCVAGGCFPGDSPGFPVEISAPGSYRLTGDLTVPDADTDAIDVQTDDVNIDLNGFALLGPTVCDPPPCNPTGSGDGVRAAGQMRITVSNGAVRGFGSAGLSLGLNAHVSKVRASHNTDAGIRTSGESVLIGNVASFNGIGIASGGVVTDNVTSRNLDDGMLLGESVVRGNQVRKNGDKGIFVSSSGSGGSVFIENTISENTGVGIHFNAIGGYGANVITRNNGGNTNPQVFSGVEIGTNICGSNTTCP